ncbi:DNA sulfur modification protein DndB [Agromyces kandeliae]|uniref:DNA sulfur modification protein DndB n=1 Tax=Agromyces kandeliae TaxID=2666141 RepID=UPI0018A1B95A|nr:DNA sulfur modification protein DndB [Agromyces kandeliae]
MIRDIAGFIDEPKFTPTGAQYRGRLTLPGVQWTGRGREAFATATVTLEQIADAAESRILWTDQSVQRGIKPTAPSGLPRELSLSDGYPDDRYYVFDSSNADELTDKLLRGERLFLNSLVWNLRPGHFEAYWDDNEKEVTLYSGKVYLPDSHHRHQAILKAVRAFRDRPAAYPKFDPSKEFKVELYFLSREDEGNYFFDKNQRPKPTALSKAYDLTTEDDLSTLAKRVLDKAPSFEAGVNRATDRLSKKAPHFVTLSTLREVMRTFAGSNEVEEAELDGLAATAAEFLEMLAEVRPELRPGTSHLEREQSLASAAVMMHGYAALMQDYGTDLAKLGSERARLTWGERLSLLAPTNEYDHDGWRGDFLSKENPLWQELGVTRVDRESGKILVSNNGGTRARAGTALRRRVGSGT